MSKLSQIASIGAFKELTKKTVSVATPIIRDEAVGVVKNAAKSFFFKQLLMINIIVGVVSFTIGYIVG